MTYKPTYEKLKQRVRELGDADVSMGFTTLFLRIILYTLLIVSGLVSISGAESKQVLVLNSYHQSYKWTNYIVEGIEQTLEKNIEDFDLHIEYMDTKRIQSDEYLQKYLQMLQIKYDKATLDVIIASDDSAFQFLLKYHDQLFSHTPVVFCGVNRFVQSMLKDKEYFTGVIQQADIKPTIDLALELHPGTKRIVVLSDNSRTGRAYQREVIKTAESYKNLEFVYLDGSELTHADLLSRIQKVPENSILLLTLWLIDKTAEFVPWSKGMPAISANSPVPIYGLVEVPLEYGLLGGKIQSGFHQGEMAAKIAGRILIGNEKPDSIPVVLHSPNKYIFNYKQLQRWGIPENKLPEGSIILERPLSYYQKYRYYILGAITIFVLMFISIAALSVNIIKRRQIERTLRESEERFRSIIENTDAGYFFSDRDGIIRDVNKSWIKMYRYSSRDEIIGQHFAIIQKVDDVESAKEFVAGIMRGDTRYMTGEFSRKCKDGSIGYHTFSARPIQKEGVIIGLEGFIIDITEHKQTEEALRKSEEKHRSMLDDVVDFIDAGLFILDSDYKVVWINEALERYFGLQREEIIGKDKRQLIREQIKYKFEEPEEFAEKVLATYDNNTYVENFECHVLPVDEWKELHLEHWSRPIQSGLYAGGRVELYYDVTERKQAEEALQESEEKYRSMMESMKDEAYICSSEFRLLYLNPATVSRIGFDATGDLCHKALYDLDEQCSWCIFDKVLQGENVEFELLNPNNDRYYSISNSPIHHTDGSISKLAVCRDITDAKEIELQLQQVQKMETIGILSGGIAHDFNNLLSIILGNIELAEDDITPETGASGFLNEAKEASLKAQELTKQLITFSKGGAPVKKTGSIEDLVKKIADTSLSDTDVKCEFNISSDLRVVKFDRGQMNHAVRNIITNAVESMSDSGSIVIKADNFTKTAEGDLPIAEANYVKISIRDQGVGIPEEHLSKIFDPYFSTKERGPQKGMGLGLAITYSIINRHDGHIAVESEVGVGTTFTLYLPALEQSTVDSRPDQKPEPEEPAIPTGRILVMDDEKMIRDLLKQRLSRLGYEPEVAKDGDEAVELYGAAKDSGKSFDIVILDLTIKGGAGGKEVIKRLMAIDPDIKAIVSSGYSNDPVITDFRAYGFVGALPKPHTKNDLIDMLNKVLMEKV